VLTDRKGLLTMQSMWDRAITASRGRDDALTIRLAAAFASIRYRWATAEWCTAAVWYVNQGPEGRAWAERIFWAGR
jgi:hypothetical protein